MILHPPTAQLSLASFFLLSSRSAFPPRRLADAIRSALPDRSLFGTVAIVVSFIGTVPVWSICRIVFDGVAGLFEGLGVSYLDRLSFSRPLIRTNQLPRSQYGAATGKKQGRSKYKH